VGTVADNLNAGNYTQLECLADSLSGQNAQHFNKDNTTGGSLTVTLTLETVNSTGAFCQVIAKEIGGTSGIDVHNGVQRVAPGTGTDAITATALTPSQAPGLNSAWCYDGNNISSSLVKGTGFNADQLSGTLTAAASTCGENLRYTSTASQTGTFTDGTHGGGDHFIVLQALYLEAGGGTNTSITPPVGSISTVGNTGTAVSALNTVIKPVVARRRVIVSPLKRAA
jgi:hypothetical protein